MGVNYINSILRSTNKNFKTLKIFHKNSLMVTWVVKKINLLPNKIKIILQSDTIKYLYSVIIIKSVVIDGNMYEKNDKRESLHCMSSNQMIFSRGRGNFIFRSTNNSCFAFFLFNSCGRENQHTQKLKGNFTQQLFDKLRAMPGS